MGGRNPCLATVRASRREAGPARSKKRGCAPSFLMAAERGSRARRATKVGQVMFMQDGAAPRAGPLQKNKRIGGSGYKVSEKTFLVGCSVWSACA